MTPSDPSESSALTALTELLRDTVKRPTASELDRGFNVLRARTAGASRGQRARRWALVVSAVVAAVVLGAVGFSVFRSPASVAVKAPALKRIEGGKILDGGYLSESKRTGIQLFFDEGSEFVLSPGTRGRLRAASPEGVRLALEHGSASLRITKSPDHRWSVEAGPFLVTVKGTEFSVSWDPASEQFELRLRRGRVTVSGPIVGEGLGLHAGQKLSVSLPKAETVITEERPDDTVAPPASSATSAADSSPPRRENGAPAPSGAQATSPSASASRSVPERRWREALANGEWDEIVADAERDGVNATLERASSEELFALADAARYRRRVDLARAALLAQRRRFPSSARSLDALFLLGRVEELRANGKAPALGYYDQYLSRAPAGTYAAEALGRKMILTKDAAGAASARAIAEEYLRRFPGGSYAGAARALQRAP